MRSLTSALVTFVILAALILIFCSGCARTPEERERAAKAENEASLVEMKKLRRDSDVMPGRVLYVVHDVQAVEKTELRRVIVQPVDSVTGGFRAALTSQDLKVGDHVELVQISYPRTEGQWVHYVPLVRKAEKVGE